MNEQDYTTLLALAKEFLGIVSTATIKDNEIRELIETAVADMERLSIDVDITKHLHRFAIMQFVKGNFGMTDVNTKKMCMDSYNLHVSSIQCNVDETED